MKNNFLKSYSAFLRRNYFKVLVFYVIVLGFSLYFASKIKFESNFESLLPKTFKSVITLDEVTKEFGGTGYMVAVIKSDNSKAAKKFASVFSKELEKLPQVKYVNWKQPKKFFEDRRLLFADLEDLREIRNRVAKKIDFEKKKANPLFIDLLEENYELDLSDIEKKYKSKSVFREYYESSDGKELVLLIKPNGLAGDLKFSRELEKNILNLFSSLNPASYSKDLSVELTGRYKKQIDLNDQLVKDIRFTVFGSLVLGSFILFFFFKQIRGTFLVGLPLFSGVIITLAFAYIAIGYLNIISGFLFSILMGIGMDYGIVFYSRYMEEKIKKESSQQAMETSFMSAGKSLLLAAITTSVSFFTLAIADFKGFSQFGIIAGAGVIINFIVFTTLHQAMIIFFEKIKEPEYKSAFSFSLRSPKISLRLPSILAVSVICLYSAANFRKLAFEYDFNKIQGANIPSFVLDKRVNEIIGTSLTPDIALVKSLSQAKQISDLLSSKEKNPDTTIDSHASVLTFMPEDQKEKIQELKKIKKILDDSALNSLSEEQKKKIEDVKKLLTPEEVTKKNLPKEIYRMFYGESGKTAVYIFPKISLSDILLVRKASDEIKDLQAGEETIHPVSESVIFSEILRMIEKDGKLIMALSFLGTLLPIFFAYKSFKALFFISTHLLVTLLLLLGGLLFFSIDLNFFNVLMLPLIFGLGVDYGEYFYGRYKQEGKESGYFVLTHTGPAVFMSALTTILGFSTLLLANHQGLKSIGQVSVMGIFCAFISAVAFLLPLLSLWEKFEVKNEKT
ncbi:MAG: MMPL family transporter [Elusimicrobiota bacterium]